MMHGAVSACCQTAHAAAQTVGRCVQLGSMHAHSDTFRAGLSTPCSADVWRDGHQAGLSHPPVFKVGIDSSRSKWWADVAHVVAWQGSASVQAQGMIQQNSSCSTLC
jgi:hypothetical protein